MRRRQLLKGAASLSFVASQAWAPGWVTAGVGLGSSTRSEFRDTTTFNLEVAQSPVQVDGQQAMGIAINGQFPGPLLRWKEGETVELKVSNRLSQDTSIHWHGILLPYQMDGVPGVTFPGIAPGETFTYRFPVKQAGTYWYHSHSGLQEPLGHYGPIVIDPVGAATVSVDREHVIVLSDWTQMHPHRIFSRLKKMGHAFNFQQRTVADFLRDASQQGWSAAISDRLAWGDMRMNPADIADVTGATYTYLVNGSGPADNWTGRINAGERVRLRIINAASMTLFNIRIPGLPMTIVQADGLPVQPVEIDEFQMGPAETYDVIIEPREDRAYTFFAESIDRSGYARATLAPREGMEAEVPVLRERPLLTMRDMGMAHDRHGGMDHSAMGHGSGHSGMDHSAMGHGAGHGDVDHSAMGHGSGHSGMDHSAMGHGAGHGDVDHGSMGHGVDHSGMDHSAMGHGSGHGDVDHGSPAHGGAAVTSDKVQRHDHPRGAGVVNVAQQPSYRMNEPGIGLEDVPHRTLTYDDLRSEVPNPDQRLPGREMEIHLTSNMERYMWSFDGVKFSEVDGPIQFRYGERLRVTLVNDTMMPHPIHLHGMFFQLVNGQTTHKPNKHTVIVKPGEKLSFDATADAIGDWAFHCHLLYHMHAGMMQVVSVSGATDARA